MRWRLVRWAARKFFECLHKESLSLPLIDNQSGSKGLTKKSTTLPSPSLLLKKRRKQNKHSAKNSSSSKPHKRGALFCCFGDVLLLLVGSVMARPSRLGCRAAQSAPRRRRRRRFLLKRTPGVVCDKTKSRVRACVRACVWRLTHHARAHTLHHAPPPFWFVAVTHRDEKRKRECSFCVRMCFVCEEDESCRLSLPPQAKRKTQTQKERPLLARPAPRLAGRGARGL